MPWPFKRKGVSEEKEQSRKPSDSKFKQQKLPAWQPIITASTVLPVFFFFGTICLPIGIALYVTTSNIQEMIIEYTNCQNCEANLEPMFKQGKSTNCKCELSINLNTSWKGDVFFYYGLSNFYQNHRRYVRSRDDSQLHGEVSSSVNSNCDPFGSSNGIVYAPCGAIANSMFNDKFTLEYNNQKTVPMTYKNIAWKSDRTVKFKNPSQGVQELNKYKKPLYWFQNASQLDLNDTANNGFLNQDFIVWMRVAAFPTFRKLYRILDRESPLVTGFKDGLPYGDYKLTINYNYPVSSFGGKKRFIISQSSWAGGKNNFLGIVYIVVGTLCLIFGFIFLIIHTKYRTRIQFTALELRIENSIFNTDYSSWSFEI
ncbi:cell cycle control protein 50A isoform X3 [Hydra vulgaris]|uniref:Cell cycle control protein 50A isoform X3 n=1 Tax=Hydra vulgaris TaxID=6087 RepID=A0ABM4BYI8_HYDVU